MSDAQLSPGTGDVPPDPAPALPTQPSDATLVNEPSVPLITSEPAKQPIQHLVTFPPFPKVPAGVQLVPFHLFKECGIQIFCDDDDVEIDGNGMPTAPLNRVHAADVRKTQGKKKTKVAKVDNEGEEEGDAEGEGDDETAATASGVALPTARKKKSKKSKKPLLSEKEIEGLDPVKKAHEKRKYQMAMFAKVEWYKHWAAGEDLRVSQKSYDPNSSPIDRMHIAATEFRVGRIWPPRNVQLHYLWEQFRLYTGLLGSPPVWLRTDQEQEEDEEDERVSSPVEPPEEQAAVPPDTGAKAKKQYDDDLAHYSDESEEFEDEVEGPNGTNAEDAANDLKGPEKAKTRPKRPPPRTPYGLHNVDPIPLNSDDQVNILLKVAGERRDARLYRFLENPEHNIRIFMSWYMRSQGFIFTPGFMVNFPHLVAFFLKFLLRCKVLPESERSLKRAIAVAEAAIEELPRIFKICKFLPDKMGLGCTAIWGPRWEEEWLMAMRESAAATAAAATAAEKETEQPQPTSEEKAEALRQFEEQLKAENVEFLPANPDELDRPSSRLAELMESHEEDEQEATELDIVTESVTLEVVDPLAAPYDTSNNDGASGAESGAVAFIEEVVEDTVTPDASKPELTPPPPVVATPHAASAEEKLPTPTVDEAPGHSEDVRDATPSVQLDQPSASEPQPVAVGPAESIEPVAKQGYESEEEANDWTMEGGPRKLNTEERAAKRQQNYEEWGPSINQPLTELLGMSVFPMRFEAGGNGHSRGVGVAERSMRKVKAIIPAGQIEKGKWRGVEEELIYKLARVVLAPWPDWNDGGVAPDYVTPRVQKGSVPKTQTEDGDLNSEQLDRDAVRYSHDPLVDDITVLVEPEIADLMRVNMGFAGTWVQLIPRREQTSSGGRGRGRGRGRGGRGGRGTGRGGAVSGDSTRTDGGEASATISTDGQTQPEESVSAGSLPAAPATQARGRGRGRGRGGSSYHSSGNGDSEQKESTFWYIEDIYMGVPSYWMPGEEELPIELADLGLDDSEMN